MDETTLAIKLQETTDRSLRNEGRIKKLEESHEALHQLATSVAVMAERQETMNRNVANLTEKMDNLEGKPGERWDKLISTVIGALAGAFIAWIASGMPGA